MKLMKAEPMREHSSFRAGGPALLYAVPEGRDELVKLLQFLYKEKIAYKILGNGTNILVSDEGLDCVVVEVKGAVSDIRLLRPLAGSCSGLPSPGGEDAGRSGHAAEDAVVLAGSSSQYLYPDGLFRLRAEAGAALSQLAVRAQELGLSGLEALHGIPGTVGGAVVMNAGAYGTEIKDVLECCEILTKEGEIRSLPAEALELSYRHSIVEERGWVVLAATFSLSMDSPAAIRARMDQYRAQRLAKQPMDKFSAGSTFRRPEGDFAGRLIEAAGLRGYRIGGAQVSEKHCGFLINTGTATAEEIYRLMRFVQERVRVQSGRELVPEVKLWGSF